MDERIAPLVELQSIDDGIRANDHQIGRSRKRLTQIAQDLQDLTASLQSQTEGSKTLAVTLHKRESDLAGVETRIADLQLQLNQAKSNKAFTALKHEIRIQEKKKSELEDEILRTMEQMEGGGEHLERLRKDVRDRQAETEREEAETLEIIASLEANGRELAERLAVAAAAVDRDYLRIYERLHKGTPDGRGIAAVRGYACQGCLMRVPANVVNMLMMGKLLTCQHCARIQYLDDKA